MVKEIANNPRMMKAQKQKRLSNHTRVPPSLKLEIADMYLKYCNQRSLPSHPHGDRPTGIMNYILTCKLFEECFQTLVVGVRGTKENFIRDCVDIKDGIRDPVNGKLLLNHHHPGIINDAHMSEHCGDFIVDRCSSDAKNKSDNSSETHHKDINNNVAALPLLKLTTRKKRIRNKSGDERSINNNDAWMEHLSSKVDERRLVSIITSS